MEYWILYVLLWAVLVTAVLGAAVWALVRALVVIKLVWLVLSAPWNLWSRNQHRGP